MNATWVPSGETASWFMMLVVNRFSLSKLRDPILVEPSIINVMSSGFPQAEGNFKRDI